MRRFGLAVALAFVLGSSAMAQMVGGGMVPGPQGPPGPIGPSPTISMGTLTTGGAGTMGSATDTGTPSAAVFNFTIPRGDVGSVGSTGATGSVGATGATGATGAAGTNSLGAPVTRTLALATAYQASTSAKPALVTINITSTATFSVIGGSTNTADILIGPTNGVAGGTGTSVGKYANSSTAGIAVGIGVSTIGAIPFTFALPAGYYFAVRQTGGTVTITSAFDQAVG